MLVFYDNEGSFHELGQDENRFNIFGDICEKLGGF
jgi:hypothetical protein